MKTIVKVGAGCLAAAGAWSLLIKPRRKQPGWDKLDGVKYAHRGLHDAGQGIPENSMAAFRRAIDHGFGAELDVHLMADGGLAVVHDSDLTRVCGKKALIEDLTAADLKDYPLMGTQEHIPLFQDVLALFEGKTPLVIELKVERGNYDALTDAVMAALEGWNGTYCVESFHPAVLLRLRKKYHRVLRGQLSENFIRGSEVGNLATPVRFVLTHLLTTAFTRPDFIAYNYKYADEFSYTLCRKLYRVKNAAWTIRSEEALIEAEKIFSIIIFDSFIPL